MPDKIIQDHLEDCFRLTRLGLRRLRQDLRLLQSRFEDAARTRCRRVARWLRGGDVARDYLRASRVA